MASVGGGGGEVDCDSRITLALAKILRTIWFHRYWRHRCRRFMPIEDAFIQRMVRTFVSQAV